MSVQAADAQTVLLDLQEAGSRISRDDEEIVVSFRDPCGSIGRRDFSTHWIHWYPAKMFHRIPSVFLDNVDLAEHAMVLDPFCGSGTVLLEASLRGHTAIGIDISPLAQLISRTKVTPIDPRLLEDELAELLPKAKRSRLKPRPHPILDSWLPAPSRAGLHRIKAAISGLADARSREFFLVALTSIVRRVSAADPTIPPLVRLSEHRATSAGARYRAALERSQSVTTSSVYAAFEDAATANIRRMSELFAVRRRLGRSWVAGSGAHAAQTNLQSDSVDAIITSPPYCGAQKYVRSMKLELILSGFPSSELRALDRLTLGTEAVPTGNPQIDPLITGDDYVDDLVHKIYAVNPVRARMASDYSKYLALFAEESKRLLRPGGHLLVTLGRSTLAGVPFPADRILHRAGRAAGLQSVATLVDRIPSRGLLTERHATAGRIDHEFIAWLRRPGEAPSDGASI
ncbi:MAG: hypothetical protein OXH41_11500 [Chloroflexi bacterium]|nr:hypothetical protein [Chloroflexota bacterium]